MSGGKAGKKATGKAGKGSNALDAVAVAGSVSGSRAGSVVSEVSEATQQREQRILELEASMKKLREERSFFQVERDHVMRFWDVTKRDLAETRTELRRKDAETAEMMQRHSVEVKIYKQKVKHLLYEHQNNIAQLKIAHETADKLAMSEFKERERQLGMEKRALRLELKELQLSHEDLMKTMKHETDRSITKMRQEYQDALKQHQQRFEKQLEEQREADDLRRRTEVHEVEERKNTHISQLMQRHEKMFAEVKNYYNDITHNNLDLIKSLKEELGELRKKEMLNEKVMQDIASENQRLSAPLRASEKKVAELSQRLAVAEKEQASFVSTKTRLKRALAELDTAKWELEVQQQRGEHVKQERDQLYQQLSDAVYTSQQKTGFKNLVLEKKLSAMANTLEKKDAQLGEVLRASNLDPQALGAVTGKLEDLIESKNEQISRLSYEAVRTRKTFDMCVRVVMAKMHEHGVPTNELDELLQQLPDPALQKPARRAGAAAEPSKAVSAA